MADATQKLHLSFPGETTTTAVGTVHEWTTLERARRAAMALGLMWGLAGVSIFLPILHFVLVPGFLLLGPVIAILQFTEQKRLKSMKGSCPRCKVERDFPLELRFNGKRSFTCDGCGNLIELEPAPDAAPAVSAGSPAP